MSTFNVKIEKLVFGGDGLGHAEGNTVFVPYVLPGEVVAADPVERKKKFVRARLAEIVTSSPERVAPPCPHFGACGGCHYQHMPYAAQLHAKTEILRETLRRIGRVDWPGPIIAHASPPLGYRNRAQWKIRARSANCDSPAIGYFHAGSTILLPVTQCPILSPPLAAVGTTLHDLLGHSSLPGSIEEVEAFADPAGQHALLNVSLANASTPPLEVSRSLRDAIPTAETILVHDAAGDRFELDGPGFTHYGAVGHTFRVGHLSFFQTNRFLLDQLAAAVAGEGTGKSALDLFAGVGLFTLTLAARYGNVIAVDSNLAAVRDLQANIEAAGVSADAVHRDAESYLANLKAAPDLVVLDPPRAGVPPKALARLVDLAPPRITYLSCDPATLARDLALLTAAPSVAGSAQYRIQEIYLFDNFPQTYHIETLVRLERLG